VRTLFSTLASPAMTNTPDRTIFDLIEEIRFQLTNPIVYELLGSYVVTLEDQLEEFLQLYESLGWTPTTAMNVLELRMGWVHATRRAL